MKDIIKYLGVEQRVPLDLKCKNPLWIPGLLS